MTTNHTNHTSSEGRFNSSSESAGNQTPLDDASIRALLHKGTTGTLALTDDEQPVVYNGLFVYDEIQHAIYFHDTYSLIVCGANESACLGFSVEDATIVVNGSGNLLTDTAESKRALELLLAKYLNHTHLTGDLANIPPYRIRIERWSGRQKHNPSTLPASSQQNYP